MKRELYLQNMACRSISRDGWQVALARIICMSFWQLADMRSAGADFSQSRNPVHQRLFEARGPSLSLGCSISSTLGGWKF